jgi:hypothetical protein
MGFLWWFIPIISLVGGESMDISFPLRLRALEVDSVGYTVVRNSFQPPPAFPPKSDLETVYTCQCFHFQGNFLF